MVQEGDGTSDVQSAEGERIRNIKKRRKPISVRPVAREGMAVLVEWVDGGDYWRAIVPENVVTRADSGALEVDREELEAGVPVGDDWAQVEGVTKAVIHELHREGIFTKKDLLQRSHRANAAVMRALVPPLLTRLLRFAQEE